MSLSDQSLSTRLDSASVSFTGRYINAILLLLLLQPGTLVWWRICCQYSRFSLSVLLACLQCSDIVGSASD